MGETIKVIIVILITFVITFFIIKKFKKKELEIEEETKNDEMITKTITGARELVEMAANDYIAKKTREGYVLIYKAPIEKLYWIVCSTTITMKKIK